jgi:hypothetical protein
VTEPLTCPRAAPCGTGAQRRRARGDNVSAGDDLGHRFTIAEAADASGVARSPIRRALDRGDLPNAVQGDDDPQTWTIPLVRSPRRRLHPEQARAWWGRWLGRKALLVSARPDGRARQVLPEVLEEITDLRVRAEVAEARAEPAERLAGGCERRLEDLRRLAVRQLESPLTGVRASREEEVRTPRVGSLVGRRDNRHLRAAAHPRRHGLVATGGTHPIDYAAVAVGGRRDPRRGDVRLREGVPAPVGAPTSAAIDGDYLPARSMNAVRHETGRRWSQCLADRRSHPRAVGPGRDACCVRPKAVGRSQTERHRSARWCPLRSRKRRPAMS